jgi:hypothetical protein
MASESSLEWRTLRGLVARSAVMSEPRRQRGLHHQHTAGSADEAVAARKILLLGGVPGGTRRSSSAFGDPMREFAIGRRIDAIEAGADDGERRTGGGQRAGARQRRCRSPSPRRW